NLVWSVIADTATISAEARPQCTGLFNYMRTVYAALRGGAQIYKSLDGGSTWAPSAGTGTDVIPLGAEVYTILIDTNNHNGLNAGTSAGLSVSTDAGLHWKLDGFANKKVRNILITGHTQLWTVAASPTGATAVGTVATITTTAAHNLLVGQTIMLANFGSTTT